MGFTSQEKEILLIFKIVGIDLPEDKLKPLIDGLYRHMDYERVKAYEYGYKQGKLDFE